MHFWWHSSIFRRVFWVNLICKRSFCFIVSRKSVSHFTEDSNNKHIHWLPIKWFGRQCEYNRKSISSHYQNDHKMLIWYSDESSPANKVCLSIAKLYAVPFTDRPVFFFYSLSVNMLVWELFFFLRVFISST